MSPFGGYADFAECVRKNSDKSDPEAYCGKIKHEAEKSLLDEDNMERKSLKIELKSGDNIPEGSFSAVFSRFGVVDHDGDVTLPSAFKGVEGKRVPIQGMGHNWDVPSLGYGEIHFDGEKAWVDGRFNLKMQSGRETYESIKFAHENQVNQEFSYGYKVKARANEMLGEYPGAKRILADLDPKEISPVVLGAGIDTGTLAVKKLQKKASTPNLSAQVKAWIKQHEAFTKARDMSDEDRRSLVQEAVRLRSQMEDLLDGEEVQTWGGPWIVSTYPDYVIVNESEEYWKVPYTLDSSGNVSLGDATPVEQVWMAKSANLEFMKYAEHGERTLAILKSFSARSKSLADIRAKVGRQLSEANRERISQTVTSARAALADLESLLADADPAAESSTTTTEKGRKVTGDVIKARIAEQRLSMQSLAQTN